MDIGAALSGVYSHRYRHRDGRDQPAQKHLHDVRRQLPARVPPGMRVLVSGAGQSLPLVPWIAILDLDVTTTAQEGLYVVYLYRADLARIYLSMNQGATQHRINAEANGLSGVHAEQAALAELRDESELIRSNLDPAALDGLVASIDLGAARFLPRGYEAGNIAAIEYDPTQLPGEDVLRAQLTHFLALYDDSVAIKRKVLADEPGRIKTSAGAKQTKHDSTPRPPAFRPKNSDEYVARLPEQTLYKGRRHEKLLNSFFDFVSNAGLVAANNVHPRDLTVDRYATHWLIEAKTVGSNAEHCVREAIGQLFAYRHFYYRDKHRPDPLLVALFSGPIGDAFADLLTSLGIEAVWFDSGEWRGRAPSIDTALLTATHVDGSS